MEDGSYPLAIIFMASVLAVSMLMLQVVVMFAQLLSHYVRMPLPMVDVLLSASIVTEVVVACVGLGLWYIMRCTKYAWCGVVPIVIRLAIHVIVAALFPMTYIVETLVAIAWLRVCIPLGLVPLLAIFVTMPVSIRSILSNAEGWVYTIRLYQRIRRESVVR